MNIESFSFLKIIIFFVLIIIGVNSFIQGLSSLNNFNQKISFVKNIETEKYTLDASKNPKDKGPFPTYTIWYEGDELIKFEFINWKDKKKITTIRNDLNN